MSVTFFIAEWKDDCFRAAFRCDCSTRWCDACDAAYAKGEPSPDQFFCENCTGTDINLSNANARDLISWLDLPDDGSLYGKIEARELAARCRRRLWDEPRNHDPYIPGSESAEPGLARVITADRRPGYLRSRTEELLKVCERAGDRMIVWG